MCECNGQAAATSSEFRSTHAKRYDTKVCRAPKLKRDVPAVAAFAKERRTDAWEPTHTICLDKGMSRQRRADQKCKTRQIKSRSFIAAIDATIYRAFAEAALMCSGSQSQPSPSGAQDVHAK